MWSGDLNTGAARFSVRLRRLQSWRFIAYPAARVSPTKISAAHVADEQLFVFHGGWGSARGHKTIWRKPEERINFAYIPTASSGMLAEEVCRHLYNDALHALQERCGASPCGRYIRKSCRTYCIRVDNTYQAFFRRARDSRDSKTRVGLIPSPIPN